ncbi:DM13 domain-containing protein [Aquimarina sediminis]|uniref:DM13 domain-containing protein n=1 Tax=Aquimarina sediminis TaxID=2070536 RepID=UPI000FFE3ADE|nr:DM13 domain-containing protein [Aquimarina sediminis]
MKIIATATIQGPEAKGNAQIVELEDKSYQLQLIDFWVATGAPDVRIVFGKDPDGKIAEDNIRFISSLPDGVFTENFTIDHINDLVEMKTLIVYCKKFFAHFGHGKIILSSNKIVKDDSDENPVLKIIKNIPEGYSEGKYNNKKYSITKETFNDGKSFKIFGEELQGNDFISLNYYITSSKNLLKPCEMPEDKVIHFLKNVTLLKDKGS